MGSDHAIGRRGILTLTGGTVTFAGLAGGSVLLSDGAGATAEMELTAPSLEVTTPNGTVEEIVVYLTADATYSGFDEEITELGFTTTLNGESIHSGEYHVNHPDWIGETGPESGDFTYRAFMDRFGDRDRVFLFEDTSFEPADFAVPEPGASRTFELEFDVEFEIISGEKVVTTRTDSATATLTIHHEAADGEETANDDGDDDTGDGDAGNEPEASMGVSEVQLVVELPDGETVSS